MKNKNITITIPQEILNSTNLLKENSLNILVDDSIVIIEKEHKNARDILKTIGTLSDYTSELMLKLAIACGTCDNCCDCSCGDEFSDEDLKLIPDIVLDTFLGAEICLPNLIELIESEEIIDENC